METLYLLSGDDDFAKEEFIENLKQNFSKLEKGINLLYFDKDNISSLKSELTTYTFFSDPKLIIVKVPKIRKIEEDEEENDAKQNTSNWFDEDMQDSIINRIENITLVFVCEDAFIKLTNFISKNGKVIKCEKETPQKLASWATNYAKEQGFSLDNFTSTYLINVCGSNKRTISNELEKLFSYVENNNITKEDIDNVCTMSSEIIIFKLTDNVSKKNKSQALKDLEDLLSNKEPIQKILVMVTRQFKSLLIAKECIKMNKSIIDELGVKPYSATLLERQAANYTMEELIKIFKDLAKLDIESKTIGTDVKIGIQKIIMA